MSRKQRLIVSHLSAALAVTSVGMIPTVAFGQAVLEEVVVTARKREETMQETPVAVSAFSGENLVELGIRDISDLTKVVPNIDMYSGNGTTGAGNIFIRGIGARNTGINFDSGVGVYIDGVYVSRADGAVLDNVDVQSVQVLRGPQGTLFGKNTTGGAILYTTNKPNEELGGHVEVRAGNYNQQDGQATLNVPLIGDTLMSRFSLYQTKRDGYVQSVIPEGLPEQAAGNTPFLEDEYNNTNRWGGQAQLRWVPTDDLLLDLNYNYGKTDQNSRGQNCEVVTGVDGTGWQSALQNAAIIVPSTGLTIAEWCQINDDLGPDKIMANLDPNKYEAEVNTLAFTANWDINDVLNFQSISSWRNTEGGEVNELDAIGIALLGRSNFEGNGAAPRNTDAYTQEFQLAGSAFDEKLDYVVGVFGFHEETDKGATSGPTLFFNALSTPNRAFYNTNLTELLAKNSSVSAFSQADWHFDDYWTLTVGARYTWEERRITRRFRVPDLATLSTEGDAIYDFSTFFSFPSGPETFNPDHEFIVPLVTPAGAVTWNPAAGTPDPNADQTKRYDTSKVNPMFSIQRTFDGIGFMDFGNAYFTVANGFLSGGLTDTVSTATGLVEEYDPEEVWNYELGFKMDAWDRKLRLNTALFYTDYKDRQLTTVRINPVDGRISGALINAKSSYISGIEFEAVVLPVENLQITANMTFNESDIKEYDDERITTFTPGQAVPEGCTTPIVGGTPVLNCPIDRSNENLPRLPDAAFYMAIQYTFETQYGTIMPLVSGSYRTNLDNCFDSSSCLSGIYKVNQTDITTRLTWNSPDMEWRVTAYGQNLTDNRYVTGGTPLVDVTSTAGTIYNLPRTYGIEAAYTW